MALSPDIGLHLRHTNSKADNVENVFEITRGSGTTLSSTLAHRNAIHSQKSGVAECPVIPWNSEILDLASITVNLGFPS